MKKIVLMLICLFLLTGCDAVYNLEIDDNKIIESTNFYFNEHDYNFEGTVLNENLKNYSNVDELINSSLGKKYSAFSGKLANKDFYKKKRISYGGREGINLKYVYNYKNFGSSSMLNSCSDTADFINNYDSIILNYKILSTCFFSDYGSNLDSLVINIKTDLEVSDNNADEIKGNTYTWYLDSDYNDKSIKMVIKKNHVVSDIVIFSVAFIMPLIVFIIVYNLMKKKKLHNRKN